MFSCHQRKQRVTDNAWQILPDTSYKHPKTLTSFAGRSLENEVISSFAMVDILKKKTGSNCLKTTSYTQHCFSELLDFN